MTTQSAIYLTGNKRKLYKDIAPHLEGRKVLVDLFTGSGTVAINSVDEFERVIANEGLPQLAELHRFLQSGVENVNHRELNQQYEDSKAGYLKLREDYNKDKDPAKLLLLIYRSNSNMMRFNSKGDFNMTYGERERYDYNRITQHHKLCQDITFCNEDFGDMLESLDNMLLNPSDVVIYLDPPYMGTVAPYCEGGKWTENDNQTLFEYMDTFHDKGYKMVMSNVFQNRGNTHESIIEWVESNPRFDVHDMDISYSNSSFRKSNKPTKEVLIVSKNR